MKTTFITATIVLLFAVGCSRGSNQERNKKPTATGYLAQSLGLLKPLHKKLPPPRSGDWLETHAEDGQTYRQWLGYEPTRPTDKRKTIYIQPIGNFTDRQGRIVTLTAEYMELFFNLPVKVRDALPLSLIPGKAQRVHWENEQLLTTYILDDILIPRLPEDGAAILGLTAMDLWPGDGWNFVFGQASLVNRVGVWSMARYGKPASDFNRVLLRTIKTATHETGHMFSIQHCIKYQCTMCGSNSMDESDRRPVWLCPECHAKVCDLTQCDPVKRFLALAEFWDQREMTYQAEFFKKSAKALESLPKPTEL